MSQYGYDPRYAAGPPPPPPRQMSGVWVAVAVVGAVFVVLLGVTVALLLTRDGGDAGGEGSQAKAEPAPSQPPAATDPAAPPQETPAEGDVVVPDDVDLAWFRSPSGNITCGLARGGQGGDPFADCTIGTVTWTVDQPADCELAWGGGQDGTGRVSVPLEGEAGVVCAGDVFAPEGSDEVTEIPYGQAIWLEGEIVCRSAETGVSCESLVSGSSFAVSRGSVEFS